MIARASATYPEIRLEEVDVAAHPEVAVRYGVMATPAIAIDGQLAFQGVPSEDALLARLASLRR